VFVWDILQVEVPCCAHGADSNPAAGFDDAVTGLVSGLSSGTTAIKLWFPTGAAGCR